MNIVNCFASILILLERFAFSSIVCEAGAESCGSMKEEV